MFRQILLVFSDKELRIKLLKIVGLLVLARLLTQIPLPVLGQQDVSSLIEDNAIFGLLDTISGGGYGTLSFVMLGISPYITSSIVFQLLGVIVPKINQIKKEEGEKGQQKINRWTRLLTLPLAALNGWGIMRYVESQGILEQGPGSGYEWFAVILALTAGAVIMMYIGEIISEFKMGNGISLLILAGIVSKIPSGIAKASGGVLDGVKLAFEKFQFGYLFNGEAWANFWYKSDEWTDLRSAIVLLLSFIGTLLLVVFVNDAVRKLLVVYSRRGHAEGSSRTLGSVKADLPIKVNVAGVIPIIFAVSFIMFPTVIATFLSTSNLTSVREKAEGIQTFLSAEPTRDELTGKKIQKPDEIRGKSFLGFYLVDSEEKLLLANNYDPNAGADLFGFTINNFKTSCDYQKNEAEDGGDLTPEQALQNTKNSSYKNDIKTTFFAGTFAEFNTGCNQGVGFLPEFGMHWNGVSAYNSFYFFLVVFFTYFYTATVAFKVEDVAENLQKSGAYLPGSNPGKETEKKLAYIANRLNVAGSLFLAVIAIFPIIIGRFVEFDGGSSLTSVVGGTTLLILVSVTIDSLRQIKAQTTAVDYERFTKY